MRGTEQKTTLELKLEKLRSICEKSPDNHIGLLALAETAFRRGLRLEALEAYQKVLKDESVAEAHLCMAQMYRHHGLYQEAISELRVLFEMEPGYPEAHVFARELSSATTLPQDIEEILLAGCGNDELALARVRLSIARSLVLREGQELVAIQDANAGDPTFGYYIFETRKRLSYCEEVLSQLTVLEDARKAYLADLDRQRQIERERQRAAETPVVEAQAGEEAPVVETRPVEPLEGSSEYPAVSVGQFNEFAGAEEPVSEEIHSAVDLSQEIEAVEVEEPAEEIGLDESVRAVEPALWDDHPTYVAPAHDSGESGNRYPHPDLPIDITPTLEGALPEPGALWDDEPAAQRYDPAGAHPGLPGPDTYDSGLGDDLEVSSHPVADQPTHLNLEPEEVPVLEALPPEPPAPVAVMEPVQRDFASLYAPLLASLDGLIQTLAKTRSVSSVFLLNREGYAVVEQVKDSIGRERLSEFIIETVAFLEAFANAPQYWVLECAGGIVVIQSVDSYHYLVTIGQTGANFGALRYTMDRVRPNFEQVLQPACPA
ncbi:MAG: tetratricopeptide repeat protein [Candidatus Eremiobacteraeota bacterium]|nr:tetratricopeptide repeat protein [Candidatus Eremiobacteraeota bacterium]MCW5866288.1 tetratricopeptide repeat protein [Candidatus Eremiobacteraeota bacterium]